MIVNVQSPEPARAPRFSVEPPLYLTCWPADAAANPMSKHLASPDAGAAPAASFPMPTTMALAGVGLAGCLPLSFTDRLSRTSLREQMRS